MKKEKKLKLDTLSSNELANKETSQVRGGQPICPCICQCSSAEEKIFLLTDNKLEVRNGIIPE